MSTRKRGCVVQPVVQLDKYGLRTTLATAHDGKLYLVNNEGVGYEIKGTQAAALDFDGMPIDLADAIRMFGSRLENNFGLWYTQLTGEESAFANE